MIRAPSRSPSPPSPAKSAAPKDEAAAEAARNATYVESVVGLMDKLAAIMEEELRCLAAQNVPGIAALRPEKEQLVIQHQSSMKALLGIPGGLQTLPLPLREKLQDTGRRLDKVAIRNASAMKGAAQATRGLMEQIVVSLRKEKLAPQGYSDPRQVSAALGGYSPTCRPVALRRSV